MEGEPPKTDESAAAMAVMPLGDHLEELRSRLIKCLLAVAVAFFACWVFRFPLLELIKRPHVAAMTTFGFDPALAYRSYFEPLVAQVKMCVVVAAALTAPLIIYQIWAFVAPGLFSHERRKAERLGAACVLCFAAGIGFGYFVFVPIALRYMVGLAGPGTTPVLMIGDYLGLFVLLTFAVGVAFQTPVVICYLIRWGIIAASDVRSGRRFFILAAFVIGAVLTPPDPLTQVMMAVTLIALYDLGALLGAPSRASLFGFLKFTGGLGLLVGGVAAWFALSPVAQVTAVRGSVSLNGVALGPGIQVRARRGSVCTTGADGVALIAMGGKAAARAYLAGDAQLSIQGKSAIALVRGECLAEGGQGESALEVRSKPASVIIRQARAELTLVDPHTLRVVALQGTLKATTEAGDRTVLEGRQVTLREGGEPADVPAVEQRWRERLQKEEEGRPAPTP